MSVISPWMPYKALKLIKPVGLLLASMEFIGSDTLKYLSPKLQAWPAGLSNANRNSAGWPVGLFFPFSGRYLLSPLPTTANQRYFAGVVVVLAVPSVTRAAWVMIFTSLGVTPTWPMSGSSARVNSHITLAASNCAGFDTSNANTPGPPPPVPETSTVFQSVAAPVFATCASATTEGAST